MNVVWFFSRFDHFDLTHIFFLSFSQWRRIERRLHNYVIVAKCLDDRMHSRLYKCAPLPPTTEKTCIFFLVNEHKSGLLYNQIIAVDVCFFSFFYSCSFAINESIDSVLWRLWPENGFTYPDRAIHFSTSCCPQYRYEIKMSNLKKRSPSVTEVGFI